MEWGACCDYLYPPEDHYLKLILVHACIRSEMVPVQSSDKPNLLHSTAAGCCFSFFLFLLYLSLSNALSTPFTLQTSGSLGLQATTDVCACTHIKYDHADLLAHGTRLDFQYGFVSQHSVPSFLPLSILPPVSVNVIKLVGLFSLRFFFSSSFCILS